MSDANESSTESSALHVGVVMGLLLVLGAAVVLWSGVFRFGGKTRLPETKVNLKAAFTAMRSLQLETDVVESDFAKTGFRPERGNRFAYFAAESGPVERRSTRADVTPPPSFVIVGVDVAKFTGARDFSTWSSTGCPLTPAKRPDGAPCGIGVCGEGLDAVITFGAAGDIDGDPGLDCWSLSNVDREANGDVIPAGQPFHELSDL